MGLGGEVDRAIAIVGLLAVALTAHAQGTTPGTAGEPGTGTTRISPRERLMRDVRLDQKLNNVIPLDLLFRDETGQVGPLRRFFGKKPVMLMLIQFRCTMLCNEELNVLTESLKEMSFTPGKEFNLLIVSIDPRPAEIDVATEKKAHYLKEYGRQQGAAGWHWLTGDEAAIQALTEAVGYHFVYDASTDQYAHPDGVIVVTPEGKVSRYFIKLEYPARDMKFALMEATKGRIGSYLDAFALLCYHYNPITGKYGIALMKVLRMAGIATVLMMAMAILVMKRRDVRNSS